MALTRTRSHPLGHAAAGTAVVARPQVEGKFLYVGAEKLWVRGTTYGTFRSEDGGGGYLREVAERDLAVIAETGLNAIRTYTVPPRWLLDVAATHGLRVLVGLPWEQHVAFLDEPVRCRSIVDRVRAGVRGCAGHPAVLCYAIGNETPRAIVRWHGARRVERFIHRLYNVAKAEDPAGLVTYVNYPSTEYLHLPFLDLVTFNVYLESPDRLEAYLAHLHNIAGDRPLVMTEIGLDSRRHGEAAQARALAWQVRATFQAGCAGAFVFAWTDEWYRGGHDIDDWDFGLTDRARRPKPALAAVRESLVEVPFPKDLPWPRISVVVCSYNGSKTIRDCFDGLLKLEYPDFEVIVVDDGSTDDTAAIASEYGFRVISTENRGLSSARNTGLAAATGEVVAYTDDDARPDPHWLTYLGATFMSTRHAGVGGPNIAPPGDGPVAECVANAPGGPVHVLFDDREAEHIPGCNMAFRKSALEAIGGFDPQFRSAGDDVDVCWRIQRAGWTLGFNPAAMVWHHRRNSVRAYWKQQLGYGKAEALLERKWPEKYNAAGHLAWSGRLYGKGLTRSLVGCRGRIYQGIWGGALFQSVYEPAPSTLCSLALMPEWYLMVLALVAVSALGASWRPLAFALPVLGLTVAASLVQAARSAVLAVFSSAPPSCAHLQLRVLTAALHLLQPLARLRGRFRYGLTPWRRRGWQGLLTPRSRTDVVWSEDWQSAAERLAAIETAVSREGAPVLRGGPYDRWDLEVRGGILGAVRVGLATEEHGQGRQLVLLRSWPRCSRVGVGIVALLGTLGARAGADQAMIAAGALGGGAVLLAHTILREYAAAAAILARVLTAPDRTRA